MATNHLAKTALKKKVIVIGLDGLEPSIVEPMVARGELPCLASIARQGYYSRLTTTYPAQTPVAWSSFATGTNPGGHGIFDFVSRDPQTYQPDFALTRFEQPKSIFAKPRAVNRRSGVPVWQRLSDAGIPSVVLRCPCTFPPDAISGRMLAGVGVPDLRGSQGRGTLYTQNRQAESHGESQIVILDSGPKIKTHIAGPRFGQKAVQCEIRVEVNGGASSLVIEGSKPSFRVEVPEKTWSAWIPLQFNISPLQSIRGTARFYVRQVKPQIEFYISPVNFDPAAPPFPISSPLNYAKELSERIGMFSTLGMAEDHSGLEDGHFDEAAFLAQCDLVVSEREKMARYELDRFTEGLFFVLFDTPDRVQHMLWRFRDKDHPFFDPDHSRDFGTMIEEHYRRYDQFVGRALQSADDETLVMVLSDHGFSTFRRAFHVNTWLLQNGFMALHGGQQPEDGGEDGFRGVDWSRTHAYALGLGSIYLNLKGREREGIVEPNGEAERVSRSLQKALGGVADPLTGDVAVQRVLRRDEIYSGAFAAQSPDLLLACSKGYRSSWQTALGGIPRALFDDNLRKWSGDHIIDPSEVPGIFFMNKKTRCADPNIIDLAPTILSFFGLPPGAGIEGQRLL